MPTIRILEFNELTNSNLDSNVQPSSATNSKIHTISKSISNLESNDKSNYLEESKNSRKNKIIEALRLNHLDNDESASVERLIHQNADCFYLPGEPLGFTNVLQHRIPTIDDAPVHTR